MLQHLEIESLGTCGMPQRIETKLKHPKGVQSVETQTSTNSSYTNNQLEKHF